MAGARVATFDNAKMTLVALVVVGHSWTLLPSEGVTSHLYDFLYTWHVPALVLVTGFLSRSFDWSGSRLWQLVRTVVVPYVVFEAALALFRVHVGGEQLEDLFADPHWPMWYLSALFFWRLMTPVFKALPAPVAVVVSVALSLAAGTWAGDTLDLARVFGLLPFFVLGLVLTTERIEALRATWVRVVSAVAFVAVFVLSGFTDRLAATEWLYYRARYDDLTTSDLEALVIRSGVLAVGLVGAFAFLSLVPRVQLPPRSGWYTRMGAASLVVYLFHGFVVKGVEYTGFPAWAADGHQGLALLLTTVAAVALALVLACRPVSTVLTELVDPLGWAERRARHAVDLSVGVAVHEATVEVLEERVERAVEQAAAVDEPTGTGAPGTAERRGPTAPMS